MISTRLSAIAGAVLLYSALSFGSNVPFSTTPPGGLSTGNVPQFVVISSDDNTIDSGVFWITDFLKNKTNPAGRGQAATLDGAPVHMNFYLIGFAADSETSPLIADAWKAAYQAGHEIGNHTYDHVLDLNDPDQAERNGYAFSKNDWLTDMKMADTAIAKAIGFPTDSIPYVIKGFRTPRLEYNDSTFMAITERGFLYDCSIEEGYEDGEISTPNQNLPGKFYWPFTLDNGSPADKLNAYWWKQDTTGWTFISAGNAPGLWEVPVYCWILPDSASAVQNGADPHIRDSAAAHTSYLADGDYKVTGFDYNLLATYDNGSYELDSAGYYATMKYNFDQTFSGNRHPFTLNIHTDECYPDASDTEDNPRITPSQRRHCIEAFITYLSAKPDVRFVTSSQLVAWMRTPVGLDGTIGSAVREKPQSIRTSPLFVKGIVNGKLLLSVPVAGSYQVHLYNAAGVLVAQNTITASGKGSVSIPLKNAVAGGFYVAKVHDPRGVTSVNKLIAQ